MGKIIPNLPDSLIPVQNSKTIQRRSLTALSHNLPDQLHPVLQRVYLARHLTQASDLDRSLKALLPWDTLYGIQGAVALLVEAITTDQRVVIVGDFDADGATASTVAVRALRAMGLTRVDYVVPDRVIHGYGLTPAIVAVAAELAPDLLVTVDNGIASVAGVAAAQALGIKVLVTDHHLPGGQRPAADAIVNPNCPEDTFPSKALAGVGVIFYVMLALRTALRHQGWFTPQRPEPNLANLLDLVALGTVADVVPLDRNNRILVAQGLARIRGGHACPGITALANVAGRSLHRLTSSDLGFFIGPRINAAGRLEDMSLGVECLLTDDPKRAKELASRLDELNRERRAIENDMQEQALVALQRLVLADWENLPWGLALYDPTWHPGVVGILASRLKDRFNRPTIAFAPVASGELRGSARSIPGLHIRDTLDAVAQRHPGLLTRFGGHAMAAGLALPIAHYTAFAQAFDEEVHRRLTPEDLCGVILSDGELDPSELTLELAEALRAGGPWGQNFPEPLFDGAFYCLESRIVGDKHLKLRLRLTNGIIDAIAFNSASVGTVSGETLRLAYRLDVNEYRDTRNPQLVVEHLELRHPGGC